MCATGPLDLTSLSDEDLIVMYRTGTPQERKDAASELYPRIRRIARRVVHHRPIPKQWKCDFEEEMPAEIFKKIDKKIDKGAFDAAKGCFQAWCFVVLHHRYVDWVDQRVTHGQKEGSFPVDLPDPPGPGPKPPAPEPFSERELHLLRRMSPMQRVICISAAGWWRRVPPEVWQEWLTSVDIPPPFPPEEILDIDQPRKRFPLLAAAAGMKWAAVKLNWHRGCKAAPFREVSGADDFD